MRRVKFCVNFSFNFIEVIKSSFKLEALLEIKIVRNSDEAARQIGRVKDERSITLTVSRIAESVTVDAPQRMVLIIEYFLLLFK